MYVSGCRLPRLAMDPAIDIVALHLEAQAIMELPERTALSIVQPGVLHHGALPVPIGRIADMVPPVA